jgi:hypothetical protein
VPTDGSGRWLSRLPAVALWSLVWLLNVYEFLVAF